MINKENPEKLMTITGLDENGQPLNRLYSRKRLNDRAIDELIGITRGITADSVVNQQEAEYLYRWMERNTKYSEDRIINMLYSRIREMLEDNILDHREQQELMELLQRFSGQECPANQVEATSATFPLNQPPPTVDIPGASFCLTGKFAYGPRKICAKAITNLGGFIRDKVTQDTDYLIIGSLCSSQWIHTSYGRKIEKAMELRENKPAMRSRPSIIIIHEDHWAKFAFAE